MREFFTKMFLERMETRRNDPRSGGESWVVEEIKSDRACGVVDVCGFLESVWIFSRAVRGRKEIVFGGIVFGGAKRDCGSELEDPCFVNIVF